MVLSVYETNCGGSAGLSMATSGILTVGMGALFALGWFYDNCAVYETNCGGSMGLSTATSPVLCC